MSNDSELFPARWKWEEKGYRADEYGHWLLGTWQPYDGPKYLLNRSNGLILSADGGASVQLADVEDVALPLYQGAMIHRFSASACSLVKTSTPWVLAAASAEAQTVMLFSASMLNAFIDSPVPAACRAVITCGSTRFNTPKVTST
jgi:hypothetical protein